MDDGMRSPSPPKPELPYDAAALDADLAHATGPEIDDAIKQAQEAEALGVDLEDVPMAVEEEDDKDGIADVSGGQDGTGEAPVEGDDDDDEEEEEEEEEEDDADPSSERRPKKRRKRKEGASRFLDLEVEVDSDDEEEEDDEEGLPEGFIVDRAGRQASADIDEDEQDRNDDEHRNLDRRRREFEDKKAEDLARELDERNRERRRRQLDAHAMGDSMLPRSAIMPDVNDPTIWGLRVKKGRERDIVMSIFRKVVDQNLSIASAFCRDSIEGWVYVEARFEAHVRAACHGIVGVYANTTLMLVPLEERPDLLRTKKRDTDLQDGGWVRFKRGKYAGDLAQIVTTSESGAEVVLRYIPRIDYTPREKDTFVGSDGKKRKKGGTGAAAISFRPPAAFFNAESVKRAYGQRSIKVINREHHFGNDVYANGYLIKEHNISSLVTDDVNPTIDEITHFAGERQTPIEGQDDDDEDGERDAESQKRGVDYNLIAEAQRKAAKINLQPGDHVEVFEGDQKGIEGVVEGIENDVVSLMPSADLHPELAGTKIDVPGKSVRKRFKIGDHVKVLAGTNVDETGLVTHLEGDILTFISDLSQKQVQVFSKDVREAAEVGAGVNVIGQYELHDLVQLDATTSAVIFKTERDMFRVLDQTGTVRTLKPAQISGKIDSSRTIATDSEGVDIRPGDMVKEAGSTGTGGHEGRSGRILHVYRSLFAFLHNREIQENGGVFVVSVRYLTSMAPKNVNKAAAPDLTRMNPAVGSMAPPPVPPGVGPQARRTGRDPIEGLREVFVSKGPYKGHKGTIKDVNGLMVRIELETSSKLVTIERAKLLKNNRAGQPIPVDAYIAEQRGGPMRSVPTPNGQYAPSPSMSATPGGSASPYLGGRTPNPYAQAAAGLGGRTPNPYAAAAAGGGRTPNPYAAANNGRTPNPYASGIGGKTPNPYASGVGGKTPNPYAGDGGKTPNPYDGSRTPMYGATSSDDAWNPQSASASSSASKDTTWDANSKTPYTSNDDRAGGASGTTPRYGGGSTPAATGTGAYGNYQGQTPHAMSGVTPRDSYDGRSSYGSRESYGGRDSYNGPSASSSSSYDNKGTRFGTATNTMALGAPSRYGAPTPAGNAPTPGSYGSASGSYSSANTPYNAATPAAPTPYDARTPYDAPTPGASRGSGYYGAPTPGNSGPTPGPSYDNPTPRNDAYDYAPPPAHAPTPGAYSAAATPAASYGTPRESYGTPAPYGTPYGQTPAYAGTPSESGSVAPSIRPSEGSFVPPDWPELGLVVRIVRDADTLASFAGARFDDMQVIITMVPPHRPYEKNTVNVRMYDTTETQAPNVTLPSVPINFLELCRPTRSDERAVVVGTGRYRHARVTTRSADDTTWLCAIDGGGQEVFEGKMLCRFVAVGAEA